MDSVLHEFFGCAQDGWLIACDTTDVFDAGPHHGVGNVGAIPRQEVSHPVHSCNRDVRCIHDCSRWNRAPSDESYCQSHCFRRSLQDRNSVQRCKSLLRPRLSTLDSDWGEPRTSKEPRQSDSRAEARRRRRFKTLLSRLLRPWGRHCGRQPTQRPGVSARESGRRFGVSFPSRSPKIPTGAVVLSVGSMAACSSWARSECLRRKPSPGRAKCDPQPKNV